MAMYLDDVGDRVVVRLDEVGACEQPQPLVGYLLGPLHDGGCVACVRVVVDLLRPVLAVDDQNGRVRRDVEAPGAVIGS